MNGMKMQKMKRLKYKTKSKNHKSLKRKVRIHPKTNQKVTATK